MSLKKVVVYGAALIMVSGIGCGKKKKDAKMSEQGPEQKNERSIPAEKKVTLPNGEELTFKRVGGPEMAERFRETLTGKLRFIMSVPESKLLSPEDREGAKILVLDIDGGDTVILSGPATAALRKQPGKKVTIVAEKIRRTVTILGVRYFGYQVLEVQNIE